MFERAVASHTADPASSRAVCPGDVIGELDIPRLHLSGTIVEGDDDTTLAVGIGHLRDTPLPWDTGNSALAAHRDAFFRPLKDAAAGDMVRLRTVAGTFTYRVVRTAIVDPQDLSVIQGSERPTLTLITCYPFSYIGRAPRRFVVQAERIGATRPAEPQ